MSMKTYRPAQREVPAEILMPAGWVGGILMVPESQSLMDFLAQAGAFLKLVNALLPGHAQPSPFFALQRDAVSLIAPKAEPSRVEAEGSAGITSPWSIACLFEHGTLHGRLDFLTNQRLSDYLRTQTGFLVVRDAVWMPPMAGAEAPGDRRWATVIVNVARLHGISEASVQTSRGHPGKLAGEEWA